MSIPDYMSLLSTELPGIGPEGKFLALKMLHDDSWQHRPAHSATYLAALTNIPVNAVARGRDQLLEEEMLEAKTVQTANKQVSRQQLAFSPRLADVAALKRAAETHLSYKQRLSRQRRLIPGDATMHGTYCCQHLIADLLESDTRKTPRLTHKRASRKANKHPIHFEAKLLLCVLLRYSDHCGAVRNLGMSNLIQLTGMKESRIIGYLNKLKEAGYIRTSVAGLTDRSLIMEGKTAYFLNVKHKNFGIAATNGDTFVISKLDTSDPYTAKSELINLAYRGKASTDSHFDYTYPTGIACPALESLAKRQLAQGLDAGKAFLFCDKKFKRQYLANAFLDMKIEQYASILLSRYMLVVGEIFNHITRHDQAVERLQAVDIILENIVPTITHEFFGHKLRRNFFDNIPYALRESAYGAATVIAIAALDIALLGYSCMNEAAMNGHFVTYHYAIISKPTSRSISDEHLMTLEEYNGEVSFHNSHIWRMKAFHNPEKTAYCFKKTIYKAQSDISHRDQKQWALTSI